ncbi:uncharacterized protein LOC143502752 [Brachyhypopomus gauderio]|uniref:uncharacterized protein LOC143502752 n=1 Tax=Brachyhypopomus gauderio TaxID=698409 RepID=UPI0040432BEC
MPDFDLTQFTVYPTLEQFDDCRKVDLLLVADFFSVDVPRLAPKREIKRILEAQLVKDGILPDRDKSPGVAPSFAQGLEAAEAVTDFMARPSMEPGVYRSHEVDPVLAVKLKELELEIKIQEREAELLRVRGLQVEADKEITLKRLSMGLEKPIPYPRKVTSPAPAPLSHVSSPVPMPRSSRTSTSPASPTVSTAFDVSRHIGLVPVFRENEVDAYFPIFERIATTLSWPQSLWSLLLQCKLVGKAQEVCSSLSLEQSLDYDIVKSTILKAYELVPEAYRQNFRRLAKTQSQTFVEFAREKSLLFDKWCAACSVTTLDQLKELVLLEEFKNCLPEKMVVYLNEQKVVNLSSAATLADEFVLTHKTVFHLTPRSVNPSRPVMSRPVASSESRENTSATDKRECFYCHMQGHLIAACPTLKRKNDRQNPTVKKVNAFSSSTTEETLGCRATVSATVDPVFKPFVFSGTTSLTEDCTHKQPISILRDTGAAQSFILESVLPFSVESYCGSDVLVQGIELGVLGVPLHRVYLCTEALTGYVKVAVSSKLPVTGVSFILGNDLAGGTLFTLPEVVDEPVDVSLDKDLDAVFPTCVLTRAQARKFGDIDLAETFMNPNPVVPPSPVPDVTRDISKRELGSQVEESSVPPPVTRTALIRAQRADPSLVPFFNAVTENPLSLDTRVTYFYTDGVLMRKWSPANASGVWDDVHQIVVPQPFRTHVLSLAHDHPLSGHLGIRKTVQRLLQHFFWPAMKSDVSHCRSCHTCQLVGKPNQAIPSAPLCPIPVVGDPFERLLIDCVGPLPKSRSGNTYLLTIMCAATRFPEAIPLRSLKSRSVIKALVKFCTTFGLPKCVQSDQGSNFMSKLFAQVMSDLHIQHQVSSAYHPESQGALERFHQTFKTMLRSYCLEVGNDWDEGVPLLLFAIRDTVQESTGFSPNALVFGRSVRGPLKLLYEQWLASPTTRSFETVDHYVSKLREHLKVARETAKQNLCVAQQAMKKKFDTRCCSFI